MKLIDKNTKEEIKFGDPVTTTRGEPWFLAGLDHHYRYGKRVLLSPPSEGDDGRGCILVKPETINAEWVE